MPEVDQTSYRIVAPIASCDEGLYRLLSRNASRLKEALNIEIETLRQHGVPLARPLNQYGFLPSTISSECRARLADIGATVLDAIRETTQHLFRDYSELATALGIDSNLELAYCDAHRQFNIDSIVARPDAVISQGRLFVVETNVIPNSVPFPEGEVISNALERVPAVARALSDRGMSPFSGTRGLAQLVRNHLAEVGATSVLISGLARHSDADARIFQYVRLLLERDGVDAEVCPVEDLESHLARNQMALVYRFFDEPEDEAERSLFARIFELIYADEAPLHVIGDIRHRLLVSKATLAFVSEASACTGSTSRARQSIPWTRVVADTKATRGDHCIDLQEFIHGHKDVLVLKPSLGYGGRDVVLGPHTSQSEWEAALATAISGTEQWVVQDWLEPQRSNTAVFEADNLRVVETEPSYGLQLHHGRLSGVVRRDAPLGSPGSHHLGLGAIAGCAYAAY